VDCAHGDSDTLMVQRNFDKFAIEGSRVHVVADDNCATGAPLEAEHDKHIDFFSFRGCKTFALIIGHIHA